MKKLLTIIIIVLIRLSICAQNTHILTNNDFEINEQGFVYKKNDTTLPEFNKLIIPDSINNIKIVGYGVDLLSNSNINKLVLPQGLKVIFNEAFAMQHIDTVILPQNLIYIGNRAFLGYNKPIVLPQPNKEDHLFLGWNDSIPAGSYYFGYKEERYIATFKYLKDSAYILKYDDILINNGEIIKCFYKGSNRIIIPGNINNERIKKIKSNTFYFTNWDGESMFNDLSEVSIEEGIESIGCNCFKDNLIQKLILPHSLKTIKEGAFYNNQLKSIRIEEGIDSIHALAFFNNKITSIKFPKSIVFIDECAFANNAFSEKNIPMLPIPEIKNKTFLYWQSFKKGRYIREAKNFEEIPVGQCQPGEKMDLNLGYKAVFKEDL